MAHGPNRRNGRGERRGTTPRRVPRMNGRKARTVRIIRTVPDTACRMSGKVDRTIPTVPDRTRRIIRMAPGRRAARMGIRARRFWRIRNP